MKRNNIILTLLLICTLVGLGSLFFIKYNINKRNEKKSIVVGLDIDVPPIGYIENVKLTMEDEEEIEFEAKLDTGNGAKASHVEVGEYTEENGYVTFTLGKKKYKLKKTEYEEILTDGKVTGIRGKENFTGDYDLYNGKRVVKVE